ncbi:MAG TPA: hypothetical protein VJC17_00175 [Candidatus Dojkabacteria bacterium]|nr:hypothetical protein [Candidatus Dojkabacteria bacterium]
MARNNLSENKISRLRSLPLKYWGIFVILGLALIILGGILIWKFSYTRTATTAEEPQAETVKEEKVEEKWWNKDYQHYRKLIVVNNSTRSLPESQTVNLVLNHTNLVAAGSSRVDGNDLRIVYFQDGNFQELARQLAGSNTQNTTVSFNLVRAVTAGGSDDAYYLYYGNDNAIIDNPKQAVLAAGPLDIYEVILGEEKGARFYTEISRKWVLVSSVEKLANTYGFMDYRVRVDNFPIAEHKINLKIVGPQNITLAGTQISSGIYETRIRADQLTPGTYSITTEIADTHFHSKADTFYVSYPLYVTWTIDYEGFDVKDQYLESLAKISSDYGMPITHLFNPRVFIAGDISKKRAQYLADWVSKRVSENGDEVGLHLHMHLDMVKAAGLTPKTEPRWGGRSNGHDVLTSAYEYQEFSKLLQWSIKQFIDHGLPKPLSYRAGGWNIDLENMRALADNGFIIDSSGREYFIWGPNQVKSPWHLASTTRPYQISQSDMNTGAAPNYNLWEFPNNGMDSTNNKADVLIKKFNENYQGKPINSAQTITYLSHPHWLDTYDTPQLRALFSYIDDFKAANDSGPVIFVTLEDASKEWVK